MTNREFVSRVSTQIRFINKDDYVSDRLVLSTGQSISQKIITQKIQRRSIDRDMSLYREVNCIEFEEIDTVSCGFVDFRMCDALSKSVKKFSGLISTRYGSTIKELFSIDGKHSFTESTLYQMRVQSQRMGATTEDKFYLLNDYIYIPKRIKTLSGLVLMLDQYNLDELSECGDDSVGGNGGCESAWNKTFIAPSSSLEDIIAMTVQTLLITKQMPEDEKANLNSNER